MLMLSRKPGESIIYTVMPSSKVTVIEVKVDEIRGGHTARLASQCPAHVSICRSEVHAAAVAAVEEQLRGE